MKSQTARRIGGFARSGRLLVVGALLTAAVGAAWAESLYVDLKASEVGDLLTIIVVESTQASRTASTRTTKSGSLGFQFDSSGAPTSFGNSTAAEHRGDGTTQSSGELRTTVTAVITGVLPNGYLNVQGTRELTINNEKEILTVAGLCRPEDISTANTIRSNQLANAEIAYTGEGWIAKQQKPNIFLRILVGILPFI